MRIPGLYVSKEAGLYKRDLAVEYEKLGDIESDRSLLQARGSVSHKLYKDMKRAEARFERAIGMVDYLNEKEEQEVWNED